MLERIESAFRRVTQFTADASHELRTPVALMRTTSELALRKQRTESEYRQALNEVNEESVRTTELIENLLTLARADACKAILERSALNLSDVVREVFGRAEKLAEQNGISLACEAPQEPVTVSGDRGTLRRLLIVLLDNAVKYTPAGGKVRISVNHEAQRAVVEVRDSGVGINEADLPHIFERFYRSDKSRSRDSGGAGLGLSIAKWIVEAHRGAIQVESQPERGSTFRVLLPKEYA
jgi:signal transduction histidine kinase